MELAKILRSHNYNLYFYNLQCILANLKYHIKWPHSDPACCCCALSIYKKNIPVQYTLCLYSVLLSVRLPSALPCHVHQGLLFLFSVCGLTVSFLPPSFNFFLLKMKSLYHGSDCCMALYLKHLQTVCLSFLTTVT